jgi:lipopolysaccharide transport system ATP-binding protein
MSDSIISVENLGKKYRIQHQAERQRYVALRDVIAQKCAAPFKFLRKTTRRQNTDLSPVVSSQSSSNPRTEDFWALKDVSFDVRRGEVVGIIGRNGAGKSTLLKILSRITEPTEGRIRIKGRVASLLEVGTGFHPELTGRENIFLNGAILGMHRAEIKQKFDEIVAFAEVEQFLDMPVKRYSSGMYVRLAFAVAAHLEPEILIVDEVLAVGDAQFQKKCLGKMQDVATKEGRTVLFVSHNMGAISQLTNRCIVLAKGQITFKGKSETAIETYSGSGDNEQVTCFNVEFQPRKYAGNQMARILILRFDKNAPQFSSDENFSFIIKIRANVVLPRLRISFTIFSADGTPVGGVFGSDSRQMRALEEAEFRVTLPCPNLAPGHFYCGVGIGKGSPRDGHVDYDVVLDTLQFEVYPQPGEDGTVSYWMSGWGRIMFPAVQIEPMA